MQPCCPPSEIKSETSATPTSPSAALTMGLHLLGLVAAQHLLHLLDRLALTRHPHPDPVLGEARVVGRPGLGLRQPPERQHAEQVEERAAQDHALVPDDDERRDRDELL